LNSYKSNHLPNLKGVKQWFCEFPASIEMFGVQAGQLKLKIEGADRTGA